MFNFSNLNFDFDGDGVLDSHAEFMDSDGDGIADCAEIDFDGDGNADAVMFDTDNDGMLDSGMIDSDSDGVVDMAVYDADGDGFIDSYGIDSNGDGLPDTYHTELDTDHDGSIDTVIEGYDYNQDGVQDSQTIYHDSDNDGIYEEVIKAYDSDGDGQIDTVVTYQDLNGDGNEDIITKEELTDLDGDGQPDTYSIHMSSNGNHAFEATEIHSIDAGTGRIGLMTIDVESTGAASSTYADELDNFNPANADMNLVSGDPESAMEEWEYQGDTGRCALYAQKFVIEELTDMEIDMEELAGLAEEKGWFSEDSGTPMLNMDKVLHYYGIDSDMSFHNDITDIQECLESGGKIIVAVDADEIWYGENDDLFTPGDGANHAVEVIGFDRTDPDEPMVILNDSGNPNGCGEMVPLETFLDAWEDSNCQMITCMGNGGV